MKRNPLVHYFQNGFSLANKSLDIFIIGLFFSVPISLIQPTGILLILLLILTCISITYNLTIPVFLEQKQQGKPLHFMSLVKLILSNLKRIVIPLVVLFFLFIIGIAILFFAVDLLFHISNNKSLIQSNSATYGILVASALFISLFQFSPFFFSLEKKRLHTSLLKSFAECFKNLKYIGLIFLISFLSFVILLILPTGIFIINLLKTLLTEYVTFVLLSSSLYYYQNIIKKHT